MESPGASQPPALISTYLTPQWHDEVARRFRRHLRVRDVDDLVQDVACRALAAEAGGAVIRDPEGYLWGVARYVATDWVRIAVDTRLRLTDAPDETHAVMGATQESDLIKAEEWENIMGAMDSLTTEDRDILVRFYVDRQTRQQICAAMNLTDTQFRNRKHRAKSRLAAVCGRIESGPR